MVEKQKVIFLLDSGSHFFVIPFSLGPRSNNKVSVWGILVQTLEQNFTQSLVCSWGKFHFCHLVLLVPETPIPLLGRDFLSKLKSKYYSPSPNQEYFCMPLIEEQVNLSVWMDGSNIGRARTAPPVWVHLKDHLH
jgi:hypothetical protein